MNVTRRIAHQRLSQFLWWNVFHVQPFQASPSEVQVSANGCRNSLDFPVNKFVVKGVLLKPQFWRSIVTLTWDQMPGEQWMRFQFFLFTLSCLSYKCNSLFPTGLWDHPSMFFLLFYPKNRWQGNEVHKMLQSKNNERQGEENRNKIHFYQQSKHISNEGQKMVKYALNKVNCLIKRSIAITPFLSVHVWVSFSS